MFVPDGEVVAYLPTQQDSILFWTRFFGIVTIPSYLLLLVALLLLCFKSLKNNPRNYHPSIIYITFFTVLADSYLLLSSLSTFLIQQPLPLIGIAKFILFILFPLLFVVNLAWRQDIHLRIRYLILLAYFISMVVIIITSIPYILEQVVFARKLCFGITCPPPDHPIIFTPSSYRYLIHK